MILSQLKFLEFSNNNIGEIKADVFDSPTCRYDLLIGRDVIERMGIILDFNKHQMTWIDKIIPMKSIIEIRHTKTFIWDLEDHYNLEELEYYAFFCDETYADDVLIKDRLYKSVSATEVVEQLNHLSSQEKQKLRLVFEKHSTVFDGQLGCHPTASIHIEFKPDPQPV